MEHTIFVRRWRDGFEFRELLDRFYLSGLSADSSSGKGGGGVGL